VEQESKEEARRAGYEDREGGQDGQDQGNCPLYFPVLNPDNPLNTVVYV